jgi:hypothetical protein
MSKSFEDYIDILGVCLDEPRSLGGCWPTMFYPTFNARDALDLLATRRFELVLVGTHLPDMEAGNFLHLFSDAHPQQKWALVGYGNESLARTFGAITTFDAVPTTIELANLVANLRRQAIENVLNGTFLPPTRLPQTRVIAA